MAVALVTGVAGFIGSHLAERLLTEGWEVRGIDCFDPYYPREIKEANLRAVERTAAGLGGPGGARGERGARAFHWSEEDLAGVDLGPLLEGVDCVFHLAARPGVRPSWGKCFADYVRANVLATQRLLDAMRERPGMRLVFASSSSVYGSAGAGANEDAPLRPISPYGVTKVAGEALIRAYHTCFGIPAVMLRYFTVFGPRQRPDMAMNRFLRALGADGEIEVYGDGRQTRDFTFVQDAVAATVSASARGKPGECYNIGGGSPASVLEVLDILAAETGRRPRLRFLPVQPGDPPATRADTTRAREDLGFRPSVSLAEGLACMARWMDETAGCPAKREGRA